MKVLRAGPEAVDEAATVLLGDGLVVLPTDTVYGLAVRGDHPRAAAALAAAKGRPADQAVALLVGSREQAERVAVIDDRARSLVAELWPGPLTVVLPRRPGAALHLGGREDTVGVRWPDASFVTGVARAVGPLAVTSANRHGAGTPSEARGAAADLLAPPALVVDGGTCSGLASTVVDLSGAAVEVLRVGEVPVERLEAATRRR